MALSNHHLISEPSQVKSICIYCSVEPQVIMVAGAIPNFDSFVWISVGLFIVGLIGTMVYERSSSKAKRQQPQPQSQRQAAHPGTNTDIE
jgi:heme exporter protein D